MRRSQQGCEVIPVDFGQRQEEKDNRTEILKLTGLSGFYADPRLTAVVGLKEAHVIQFLHELCTQYGAYFPDLDSCRNKWIQLTYADIVDELFWSGKRSIERIIHKLIEGEFIVSMRGDSGHYNGKFYRINYDRVGYFMGVDYVEK